MKAFVALALVFGAFLLATAADAQPRRAHHHYPFRAPTHTQTWQGGGGGLGLRGGLSAACAAYWPKSCGCVTQERIFGTSERIHDGLNLYQADTWAAAYPHVAPEQATAVVWPGRHVEPLVSAGGGMMTVDGVYGYRTIPIPHGAIFVDTRGGTRIAQHIAPRRASPSPKSWQDDWRRRERANEGPRFASASPGFWH